MPTPEEIKAAWQAVQVVWQNSNNRVGSYLDCKRVAEVALKAAEKVRERYE